MTVQEQEQLKQSIAALETQRAVLGDTVVDTAIAALRQQLAGLESDQHVKQRKQITVLFSDLVGFTAMSEKMDVEEVGQIMSTYFASVTPAIKRHGGIIEKFIGDAIMAIFGLPRAHEDDPENGVRAALEMQQALAELNEKMAPTWGFRLRMRIGVNTGLVVARFLGGERKRDFTVVGDTVNLASRLEHAAPVDGVLISHNTYRHVTGIFDVEEPAPIQVKGKEDPIQVYLVKRARPRPFRKRTRGIEGVDSRMIGRERELQQLQAAFNKVVKEKALQMVTVIGEAGIGKSRLLREFNTWVELRPEFFRLYQGRCDQARQSSPMFLIRDMLSHRFQILESDSLATVWQKLEVGIGEMFPDPTIAESNAHLIGQMVGFDFTQSRHIRGIMEDGKQILQRGTTYLTRYFERLSQQGPILLLMDDIHWADNGSLDYITHLLGILHRRPLILIALARPTLLALRPHWAEGQAQHTLMKLKSLSKRQSRDLVAEVLQKMTDLPEVLRELIVSHAEGNPFYIEELVKMFMEEGVIISHDEAWRVDGDRLLTVKVPATLVGILQARLDALAPEPRQALQQASVVGRVFWDQILARLRREPITDELYALLEQLRLQGLVFQRSQSQFAQFAEYIFKHGLLHEVVYESVLKRDRRQWHGMVADWLLTQTTERGHEYTSLIAEQLTLAERWLEAIPYRERAGQQALVAGHYEVARQEYAQGVALSDREEVMAGLEPALRPRLWLGLGKVCYGLSEYNQAQKWLEQARDGAEAVSATAIQVEAWGGLVFIALHQGAYEQGIVWGETAVSIARTTTDARVTATILNRLAWVHLRQGTFTEAGALLLEAEVLAKAAGDQLILATVWNGLGTWASLQGDYEASQRYGEQSLAVAREVGHRANEATALGNLGDIARQQGKLPLAERYTREALVMNRDMGRRMYEDIGLLNLGHVLRAQTNDDEAIALYREAILLAEVLGVTPLALEALVGWADILVKRGDIETALQWLGVVQAHPKVNSDTQQEMTPILSQLETQVGAEAVAAGLADGATMNLAQVVAGLT